MNVGLCMCALCFISIKYYKQKITIMVNDCCENVQHIFRNRSQTPYAYSLVIFKIQRNVRVTILKHYSNVTDTFLCHTVGEKILFYGQDAKLINKHRGSSEISVGLPFKIWENGTRQPRPI